MALIKDNKNFTQKNISYNKSGSGDQTLRNRIYIYSFILTLLVIWIHSPSLAVLDADKLLSGNNMLFFSIQAGILKIAGAAVPGFFLLSGYLFFRDLKAERLSYIVEKEDCCGIRSRETRIAYGMITKKIVKRVRTLLIPYILWNLIYYGMNIIAKGESLGLGNLFDAVVYYRYNPVFWYMHQLLRITVLTPLIYLLFKNLRAAVVFLIAAFILAVKYELLPVHMANEDAIFYYCCGTVIALHADFFAAATDKRRQVVIALINTILAAVLFIALDMPFNSDLSWLNANEIIIALLVIFRVATALAVMNIVKLFCNEGLTDLSKKKYGAVFKISFFIYAVHPIEIKLIKIIQSVLGFGESGTVIFVLFIIMPVICYAMTYIIYLFMKKYMNRVYLLLSGGR